MLQKLFFFIFVLFSLIQHDSFGTTREMIAGFIEDSGLVLTPQKSAVTAVIFHGPSIIPELKRKQEEERARAESEKVKLQLEAARKEEAERHAVELAVAQQKMDEKFKKELAKHDEDLRMQDQEKSEAIQALQEMHLRQMEESRKQITSLSNTIQQLQGIILNAEKAHEESERKHQAFMNSISSLSGSTLDNALQKHQAELGREAYTDLHKKLEEVEQKNIELEAQLSAVKTGQAYVVNKDATFVRYDEPYLHTDQLRQPDSQFDIDVLTQTLLLEVKSLEAVVDQLETNSSKKVQPNLRGIFLTMAKTFVDNLRDAAKSGDFSQLPTLIEKVKERGGNGLKYVLTCPEFEVIEKKSVWFTENLAGLEATMHHKAYYKRQLDVATLLPPYCQRYYEFYSDYFDRIVPKICILIAPTSTDPGGIQISKRETIIKLLTCAIPALKPELLQPFKPFGTVESYIQMTAHQSAKLGEYTDFKEAIAEYDRMLKHLPIEHIRLVDDLLSYQYFQIRYKAALDELHGINPKFIQDISVRNVITEMLDKDVLKYGEVQVLQFSRSVADAVKIYLSKSPVKPEELLIESKVRQTLVAYSLLHKAASKMKEGNPKLHKYHAKI